MDEVCGRLWSQFIEWDFVKNDLDFKQTLCAKPFAKHVSAPTAMGFFQTLVDPFKSGVTPHEKAAIFEDMYSSIVKEFSTTNEDGFKINLWRDVGPYAELCPTDFILKVANSEDEVEVHMDVIKAYSVAYDAMLSHENKETREKKADIETSISCLRDLKTYMYRHCLPDRNETARLADLLQVSHKYQMQELFNEVECLLVASVNASNVSMLFEVDFQLRQLDVSEDMPGALLDACISFFKTNSSERLVSAFIHSDLERLFDVFLRASRHGMNACVLAKVQTWIIERISADTMADIVRFAKRFEEGDGEAKDLAEDIVLACSIHFKRNQEECWQADSWQAYVSQESLYQEYYWMNVMCGNVLAVEKTKILELDNCLTYFDANNNKFFGFRFPNSGKFTDGQQIMIWLTKAPPLVTSGVVICGAELKIDASFGAEPEHGDDRSFQWTLKLKSVCGEKDFVFGSWCSLGVVRPPFRRLNWDRLIDPSGGFIHGEGSLLIEIKLKTLF